MDFNKGRGLKLRVGAIFVYVCLLAVVLFLFFSIFGNQITGRLSLDTNLKYQKWEPLNGALSLILDAGELLPKSSKLLVSLGNETREFFNDELINERSVEGEFYVKEVGVLGKGEGYGLEGFKEVYPDVDFQLLISDFTPEDASKPETQEKIEGTNVTVSETIVNVTESNFTSNLTIGNNTDFNITDINSVEYWGKFDTTGLIDSNNVSNNNYILTNNNSVNNYILTNNNSVNNYILTNNNSVNNYILFVNGTMKSYVDAMDSVFNTSNNNYILFVNNTMTSYLGSNYVPYIGANNLTIDTNIFFVDSTNDRVGVGTVTPSTGNFVSYRSDSTVDSTSISNIVAEQAGTGDASIDLLLTGARRWRIFADNSDSDKLKIATSASSSATIFTLDTVGRLGINTTAPADTLTVKGTFNATPVSNAGHLLVDENGNVKIGI